MQGEVTLQLPAGRYRCAVERGPEFSAHARNLAVNEEPLTVRIELQRLIDLKAEHWWCGDLHVHRAIEDIELLMQAEGLHIAPVMTWWNKQNQWANQKQVPADALIRFDRNRFYHVMAGEDEREGGALLFFNLSQPLAITKASREYPSPMTFLAEARRGANVHVDVEKPFWWDVPLWLASGQVDTIGLANNHMCRDGMYETEAWGKPRDAQRLPPPRGNGYWTQELYYHVLNAGLRIPPSAGSASGVLPNPVGYNRVYVHVDGELTYEKWFERLRAGRSFVTNGPLLRCRVNGQLPGHVFTVPAGKTVDLEPQIEPAGRDAIQAIEIIVNGRVERTIAMKDVEKKGTLGSVRFSESGWLLVRAIADNDKTFRFASTAPFYVEVGEQRSRISKAAVQFFLNWIEERAKRVKLDEPEQRREVLAFHATARKFWQDRLAGANAE